MPKSQRLGWRIYLIGSTILIAAFLASSNFFHRFFTRESHWDDVLFALVVTLIAGFLFQREQRKKAIDEHRIRVFKATMNTTQDILGNFLNAMHQIMMENKQSLPPESLKLLDEVTADVLAQLRALSTLEHPVEEKMAIGMGIHYTRPNTAQPGQQIPSAKR